MMRPGTPGDRTRAEPLIRNLLCDHLSWFVAFSVETMFLESVCVCFGLYFELPWAFKGGSSHAIRTLAWSTRTLRAQPPRQFQAKCPKVTSARFRAIDLAGQLCCTAGRTFSDDRAGKMANDWSQVKNVLHMAVRGPQTSEAARAIIIV